ncbi:MAG: hypothetical protein CMP91_09220 [Gammaproteobacteria bacterium]|nr:hypothetical protein [Gammaproteobacteria bacterium]|tara:strand:- start:485954 stop:488089 length:2136 start_codon:yes stop_codon:yes gene_type:complete
MDRNLKIETAAKGKLQLPEIRQELELYEAEYDIDGSPLWHLHDPIANKYFRMNDRDVQLLALFGQKESRKLQQLNDLLYHGEIDKEELEELENFLRMNNLVKADAAQLSYYETQYEKSKQQDWFATYIRKPLFFRFPLWNPDKFLDNTLPSIRWLGNKVTIYLFVLITFLGIYLFSRQVDEFFSTFQYFFSWSGIVIYILALTFIKIFHELGHAYVAKAHGCRVPTIGVALIMGWPVLYTDTTDSWKIASNKKRMQIGVAGVSVELVIASLSLFLWSVTPDGSMRSAFFLLSTTTWIMSVFVNFNPLMRFDGYYLLSDLLRVPNLESRSFNMAKWWIRERLFGIGIEPPEHFRPVFVIYAVSVWIYRFFLFLGITFIVYTFFFKALGMALFVATLIQFLVLPVLKEVKVWWEMRDKIKWNKHALRTSAIVLIILGLIFIPWQTNVPVAAVLRGQIADLYVPEAGQLISMPDVALADEINEGQVLFEINSPQLERDINQATARYTELRWTQASQGFNNNLRSQSRVVNSELVTQNEILRGLLQKNEQLLIRAPISGKIVDIAPDIQVGDWLPSGLKIATVVDETDRDIVAYIEEGQLDRIELGMPARFFPENIEHGVLNAFVRSIDLVAVTELDNMYQASTFGGDLAVREDENGVMNLVNSHYRIELGLNEPARLETQQVIRGTAVIEGLPASFFSRVRKRFVAVFLRETGF